MCSRIFVPALEPSFITEIPNDILHTHILGCPGVQCKISTQIAQESVVRTPPVYREYKIPRIYAFMKFLLTVNTGTPECTLSTNGGSPTTWLWECKQLV